jgi:hypothetical protein
MFCSVNRIFVLRPRLKLECLSRYICLLVLTLMYCTEMSVDGIRKREPYAELQGVLLEVGEDYQGYKMEVFGTMAAAKFDVVDNKLIDLKSKKYKHKCFR